MGVVEVLDPVAPVRSGGWKVDVSRGERNGRVSSVWAIEDPLQPLETLERQGCLRPDDRRPRL